MCHHRPLQNLHPVSPLISLVWKPPHRSETHHRPPTDSLLAKDTITSSLPHALLSKKALFKWGNYRRGCVPRAVGLFCEVHSGNSTKQTDLSTFLRNKMESWKRRGCGSFVIWRKGQRRQFFIFGQVTTVFECISSETNAVEGIASLSLGTAPNLVLICDDI